uniref:Uncharacterized protein n=1 Tax=viral metagenome TaxID=1070528 RepID=A0A6M3JZF9_9ZZZZ
MIETPDRTREKIQAIASKNFSVERQDKIARDQIVLNRAADFHPSISKVYLTDLSEVPDRIKNYPPQCQAAYVITYNRWLAKHGDVPKSIRAGSKAAQCKRDQIEHRLKLRRAEAQGRTISEAGRDLKEHTLDWMERGKRVQIVVS